MTHIIYGLLDPIDNVLHYIGRTSDAEKRLKEHCVRSDGTKEKRIWIQHLKKDGLTPIMEVIEEYEMPEYLPAAEEHWYWFWRFFGAELYNDPEFIGNGAIKGRKLSVETRAKISASNTGKHPSAKTRKKLSAAKKGKRHSDEAKAKISVAKKGKRRSTETRAKISASNKGKHHSLDTNTKIASAMKNNTNGKGNIGRKHSDEAKIKMSVVKKGKLHSDETKAKMSAAHKGKHKSG